MFKNYQIQKNPISWSKWNHGDRTWCICWQTNLTCFQQSLLLGRCTIEYITFFLEFWIIMFLFYPLLKKPYILHWCPIVVWSRICRKCPFREDGTSTTRIWKWYWQRYVCRLQLITRKTWYIFPFLYMKNRVGLVFGAILSAAGIVGLILGSGLSYLLRKKIAWIDPVICGTGLLLSFPLIFGALYVLDSSVTTAFVLIFFGEAFLNMNWAVVVDISLVNIIYCFSPQLLTYIPISLTNWHFDYKSWIMDFFPLKKFYL